MSIQEILKFDSKSTKISFLVVTNTFPKPIYKRKDHLLLMIMATSYQKFLLFQLDKNEAR